MKKDNPYIANKLLEYADMLEAIGDNPYKIRAYRRAASVILKLDTDIYELKKDNFDLTLLPKIGPGIAYAIAVIIETDNYPEIKM